MVKSFFDIEEVKGDIEMVNTTIETTTEKEVKLYNELSEKNKYLLEKYGPSLFNSVWHGTEIRSRAGGMTHNMQKNESEWDIESVDDNTLLKLLELFSVKGDVVLDPFAGYLNSSRVIYSSGRKLIANDINSMYIEKSREEYNKYKGLHDYVIEPMFMIGDAYQTLTSLPTESVDMILTVLPTRSRESSGGYPANFESLMSEFHRVLKKDKMVVVILRDEVKGFAGLETFLPTVTTIMRSRFNLQFLNVMVREDNEGGLGAGSISFQYHKMFFKTHYYIVGGEKS